MIDDTQYLRFQEMEPPPGRKTKVVLIFSVRSGDVLGMIRWYGSWRQYTFFPNPGTTWNSDCLDDVNSYIRRLMTERKSA